MPQSLAANYVHIVFSTYTRIAYFEDEDVRARVFAGLATISNNLGCRTVIVGGVSDHVHILSRLSPTVCLSDLVRDLKSNSSTYIKRQGPRLSEFRWQGGYGAFSVAAPELLAVRRYIDSQEEHHRKESFQDEMRRILREHDLNWNERYLWT